MKRDATYWIRALNMQKHREGGWYASQYRSPWQVEGKDIGATFQGLRSLSSTIYFLVDDKNVSYFHQLAADEVWFFHDGAPLTLAIISPEGVYSEAVLGLDIEKGQMPQRLVAAASIFGARVNPGAGYCLTSCVVSFGFDFDDFRLFDQETLLQRFPEHRQHILDMNREDV